MNIIATGLWWLVCLLIQNMSHMSGWPAAVSAPDVYYNTRLTLFQSNCGGTGVQEGKKRDVSPAALSWRLQTAVLVTGALLETGAPLDSGPLGARQATQLNTSINLSFFKTMVLFNLVCSLWWWLACMLGSALACKRKLVCRPVPGGQPGCGGRPR